MFKRFLFLTLLMFTVVSFARTKDEVRKDLVAWNTRYWNFANTPEYRKFESEIMNKDTAYQEARKAETAALTARTDFINAEMSKTPEGKAIVEARIAADKEFMESRGEARKEAAEKQRKALAAWNDYARKNNCSSWSNEGYREVQNNFVRLNRARIKAGVDAMAKSDNPEAQAMAKSYQEIETKIAQLNEELKTAE